MKCDKCEKRFSTEKKPGAVVYGTPLVFKNLPFDLTPKVHLCQMCWSRFKTWLWKKPVVTGMAAKKKRNPTPR